MTVLQVRRAARVDDARLVLGVVVACTVALALFVLIPGKSANLELPAGLDVLWGLGTIFTVMLAPVAAGLAVCAGVVGLWRDRSAPASQARRLYVASLAVAVVFVVGYVLLWQAGYWEWLAD